ncbi:amidase [Antarcticimicrobium sediminis]|uniref:Amidase n=1 Tax=Antarcticimicrobium sediminis TaxID=2546227 RepID=A0A4R5EJN6_9RHOB|nr:amidase [Antarcticimicrobium sediminis]
MTAQDRPLGALATRTEIAAGRLTATEATEALIARISDLEPELRAWVHVDAEGARADAAALDAGPNRGPLHGVALGVKDLFAAAGLPWRSGSPIWKDRIAGFDAAPVALARRAGAIVLGKTVTTEFAGYKPSQTRNPVAPGRTPGGSSSGSAAAVAAGMVPLAFGTQTSGSVIRPASFCGVVGFKPSFDLIEPYGVTALARSFDTVGLFARDVPDVAFGIEALTGLALPLPTLAQAPCPMTLFRSAAWSKAEPDLLRAWDAFEADLIATGAQLHDTLPPSFVRALDPVLELHARIMAVEASEALAYEAEIAPDLLSAGLRAQIEEGRAVPPAQRHADRLALTRLRARAVSDLDPSAVWLTPSSCGAAPDFDASTGDPAFNRTWSLLGLPSCSVPLLSDDAGRPIGVQVVGAMGNDHGVLATANWLMQRLAGL